MTLQKIKQSKIKEITTIGIITAICVILSQIQIPLFFSPVPINLALIGVYLAGGLLSFNKAGLSMLIYCLLGIVGLPVFAGFTGGLGIALGPTGGYILGYIVAALAISFYLSIFKNSYYNIAIACVIGLTLCYALGTIWYLVTTKSDLLTALSLCVVPFLIGDAVKIAVSTVLIKRLRSTIVFNV